MIETHVLLHAGGNFGFQTSQPFEWLFPAGALLLLGGVLAAFAVAGAASERRGPTRVLLRIGSGIERATGLPAWAGAGRVAGAWALAVGFLGFVWDVAWHTDLGRDRELFTVPHTLILMGVIGIGAAGVVSVVFATLQRADVAWRLRGLRVPAGAAVLVVLSAAACIAFPLDDLWHSTYGIDVTMWSPTHLLMIGAASLAPIALALMAWEAPGVSNARRRFQETVICGAILTGLSTFQLEFDVGVPQWQALYHPALIAAAAGFALVAARALLGRWGAVRAVAVFLVLRGVITLTVGPALGHTVPHFPLYIGAALCVELAFMLTMRPLLRALLAGALVGTAGIATEWMWMQVWSYQLWQPALIPKLWVAGLLAVATSLLGMAFAAPLLRANARKVVRLPRFVALAAVAATVTLLMLPLPREGSAATAVISTWTTRAPQVVSDRNGRPVVVRDIAVSVQVTPAGAAVGADWFRVASWQGGSVLNASLRQVAPGSYVADQFVPVGGDWKSMVYLAKGPVLAAAPIAMPAEPDQGLGAIPLVAQRTAHLDPAQLLLLREAQGGAPLVAAVAYAMFGLALIAWTLAIASGARAIGGDVQGTGLRRALVKLPRSQRAAV